jgi:uncharacterized membrane-anchored protein YjiN (DUF445 family)
MNEQTMNGIEHVSRGGNHSTWREFVSNHKGGVTLAVSAFVYLVSWLILRFAPLFTPAEIAVAVAEAALIGGLCDYIALKMIFEKKWYLPNSGVLPRNRQRLIEGIANTIENEWLTPQMIEQRLEKMDLVGRLGTLIGDLKPRELMQDPGFQRLMDRAAEYLESPQTIDRLEAFIRRVLPKSFSRVYSVLNRIGVRSLSSQIAANLRRRLPEVQNDPELMGAIESVIRELGQQLRDPESPAHEVANNALDQIVRRALRASRGEIAEMVRENLMKLDDETIRRQIESRTRHHLDWIRVNGGIFGAFFGLVFALSRILARHGGELIAHLHLGM